MATRSTLLSSSSFLLSLLVTTLLISLMPNDGIQNVSSLVVSCGSDIKVFPGRNSPGWHRTRSVVAGLPPLLKAKVVLKLLNITLAASLVLLAGDISPNPGWTSTILHKPGLKVAHLNIRSLPKHLDEFKILLQDNPFDVVSLNETWLNSSWSDNELSIDGYNLVRQDRVDDRRGGGTAIYYKSKFTARPRLDITYKWT